MLKMTGNRERQQKATHLLNVKEDSTSEFKKIPRKNLKILQNQRKRNEMNMWRM